MALLKVRSTLTRPDRLFSIPRFRFARCFTVARIGPVDNWTKPLGN